MKPHEELSHLVRERAHFSKLHVHAKPPSGQMYNQAAVSSDVQTRLHEALNTFRPLCQIGSLLETSIIKNVEVICWHIDCPAAVQKADDPIKCAH